MDTRAEAIKIPEEAHARKTHTLTSGLNVRLPALLKTNASCKFLSNPPISWARNTNARGDGQDALLRNRTLKFAGSHRNQDGSPIASSRQLDQHILKLAVIEQIIVSARLNLLHNFRKVYRRSLPRVNPKSHITVTVIMVLNSKPQSDEW